MVLNEKQKMLLDMVEKEKYILVKAPAGTGKTFCSIQCAKRYIEKNKEFNKNFQKVLVDRKSTRLNSSHTSKSRMPSSA